VFTKSCKQLTEVLKLADKRYRIGEFSKLVGLSAYTLRYYEDQGLILSQRDDNGVRYYVAEDIRWV